MEKSRTTLQNQFDSWYNALHARDGQILSQSSNSLSRTGYSISQSDTSEADTKRNFSERSSKFEQSSHSPRGNNQEENKTKLLSNVSDSDGEDEVNEDIMAFYKAKEELLKRRGGAS